MDIHKFIKKCSKLKTPIGDLANDMLNDKNLPKDKVGIFCYIDSVNKCNEAFKDFKKLYNNQINN